MQWFATFLIILFAAFNSGCATPTQPAPVREAQPIDTPVQSAPAPTAPSLEIAQAFPLTMALPPEAFTAPQKKGQKPHIALLLPLKSASFGPAAEAVRQGAVAASIMQIPAVLPLQVYPTGDQVEDIVSVYLQALQAGAKIVIGPLTRNAVTTLAKSGLVEVPTLALNYPEGEEFLPENLYLFGLTAEGEARQAARRAFNDGWRTALTVTANTPLAKRVQLAFADAWRGLGGKLVAQASFSPEQTQFPALRDTVFKHRSDILFLAADAERARMVRPYLDPNTPTYATSMVFGGNQEIGRNVDLNGVLFADMPWLLVPDHPAVMVYPRAEKFSIEQERLYALGIDAFRIAIVMAQNPRPAEGPVVDGVTGQISLANHQFQREMAVAQFREGTAVATEFADPRNLGEPR
ncbi:MAG: penicillin-binding protein activator [Gammaproteobacteria bacterium]|nr:penicillin-binding protein activator [Gammaproteobacteria bacterium]MBU1978881.1 penicillin-binding protein activator [Gammaproteobacteria bacterium]